MTKQEYRFCETKGKHLTLVNPIAIVETLIKKPRLSFENIINLFFVAKECIQSKSDSWVVKTEFHDYPIAKTIPLIKRKPSKAIARLMAEGYRASASDDLALAKEFEEIESEIDVDSCQ